MKLKAEDFLGKEAKDKITGFEGVVTGVVQYLTGCNQCLVAPKAVSNEWKESKWFDEGRLEFRETVFTRNDVKGVDNGNDISAPVK